MDKLDKDRIRDEKNSVMFMEIFLGVLIALLFISIGFMLA